MRKNHDATDHFDLLPFIAILMCVLGVLLLVTVSVSAVSMGASSGEVWIPQPIDPKRDKVPILVEWDGTTAVFHRDGKQVRVNWAMPTTREVTVGGETYTLNDDKAPDHSPEFTNEIRRIIPLKATHYVLIAMRPSGFANFPAFAHAFRHEDISIGYEPIDQHKKVDLQIGARLPTTRPATGNKATR